MPEDCQSLAKTAHASLLRNDFYSFISKSVETVHPGSIFTTNWHIELIAHYLEQCAEGKIRRLIINMPPRYLKSLCVSVAWPAWMLGKDSTRRILVASYARHLAAKHSLDTRLLMQSDWYKETFPKARFAHDQNEKYKFTLAQRGFRLAVSTHSGITGEGGNYLIVDDPQNPLHIHKRDYRQRTIEWFEQIFISRADEKEKAVVVLVMQRLHAEDLTGYLIEKGGWQVLALPAIAQEDKEYDTGWAVHKVKSGEALQPARENIGALAAIRKEMGDEAFRAQYLQTPSPEKGTLVQKHWCQYYDKVDSQSCPIIQSWDTAIKVADNSDYSVCTTWARQQDGYYLLDVCREKLNYPDLRKKAEALAIEWQPQAILIEDKASGQSLIQDLKSSSRFPVIALSANTDKMQRLISVLTLFEAGLVKLPMRAVWLEEYKAELFTFPSARHDDQVDSTSQYLIWEKKKQLHKPDIRRF